MARSQFTDYFPVSKFHLVDVSFQLPVVLIPFFGFASATAPEMTLEIEDVKEGVYEHPRKVYKGRADLNTITLRQGVQFINSDFYDWINDTLVGQVTRRNLLLVQFARIALGSPGADVSGIQGVIDFSPRVPGRAWYMMQCIPTRYKGASDFDALDGGVSISELDFQYEALFQFDMGL